MATQEEASEENRHLWVRVCAQGYRARKWYTRVQPQGHTNPQVHCTTVSVALEVYSIGQQHHGTWELVRNANSWDLPQPC